LDLDLDLDSVELKFSFDSIQFNSNSIQIQSKINELQIAVKGIENFLVKFPSFVTMVWRPKKKGSLKNTFVGLGRQGYYCVEIHYRVRDFGFS